MKNFLEVTAFDGISEWMIHLDENKNPIRLYGWKDNEFATGKSKSVLHLDNFECNPHNSLFVNFKEDSNQLQRAWNALKRWVSPEDLKNNFFKK